MLAECCRSDDVSQYSGEDAAAVLGRGSSPPPDFAKALLNLPAQPATSSEPLVVTRAEPGPGSNETQSTEGSGSQANAERPVPREVGAPPDTAQRDQTNDVRDTSRDEQSPSIEVQQNQTAVHQHANFGSEAKASVQKTENRRIASQRLSLDSALRNRVQKECGPIIFPKLYRHCVASFGIHHR